MIECTVRVPRRPALIVGAGLNTALGTTLPAVSAAFRGGIKVFAERDWLPSGTDGRLLLAADHGLLEAGLPVGRRMVLLAAQATREALGSLHRFGVDLAALELPVFLALPPARPGWNSDSARGFVEAWAPSLPCRLDAARSMRLETGHHGAIALLGHAMAGLDSGDFDLCLVGGIDSWIDVALLDWLDGLGRLKGPARPQGLIPGEAAGFLLVASERFARRLGVGGLCRVLAAGESVDPSPWYLGGAVCGHGLAALLQRLLDERPVAEVTWADLNGEDWRADEWIVAYLRSAEHHADPLRLMHPASNWGDIGAASGAALVALAAYELHRNLAGPGTAAVWTASDTRPFRSACLLARDSSSGHENFKEP